MPLIILIIILVTGIYGFINYYIGLRGYQYLGSYIPILNSKVYWIIFWIIALSFIVGRFNSKFIPGFIHTILNYIGSMWMAVMLYLIVFFPLLDLLRFILRQTGLRDMKVLQVENLKLYAGIAVFSLVGLILVYGTFQARNVKINTYNIQIEKNAAALKDLNMVFLSDLHLGNIVTNSQLEKVVAKVNGLKPDIVLLGGDLIDDYIEPYKKQGMANTFRKIQSKYGVYTVLGNHDGMRGNIEEVVKNFENGGIKVLRDDYVKIAESFYVVGRLDSSMQRSGVKRKSLEEILKGVDKSLPLILLDHTPSKLSEAHSQRIDLQLSGHTHRGQLFPAGLITKKIFEVDWGYLKKEDFQVIVSSGAATWGPPVRTGSSSEIVHINVKFKQTK